MDDGVALGVCPEPVRASVRHRARPLAGRSPRALLNTLRSPFRFTATRAAGSTCCRSRCALASGPKKPHLWHKCSTGVYYEGQPLPSLLSVSSHRVTFRIPLSTCGRGPGVRRLSPYYAREDFAGATSSFGQPVLRCATSCAAGGYCLAVFAFRRSSSGASLVSQRFPSSQAQGYGLKRPSKVYISILSGSIG